MRSDWLKTQFHRSIKHRKSVFYCFSPHYLYIIKEMKKPELCITYGLETVVSVLVLNTRTRLLYNE